MLVPEFLAESDHHVLSRTVHWITFAELSLNLRKLLMLLPRLGHSRRYSDPFMCIILCAQQCIMRGMIYYRTACLWPKSCAVFEAKRHKLPVQAGVVRVHREDGGCTYKLRTEDADRGRPGKGKDPRAQKQE